MSDNVIVTIDVGHGGGTSRERVFRWRLPAMRLLPVVVVLCLLGTGALAADAHRVLRADSIADLRSLNVIQDDAVAFVSGYFVAGDHSGVNYRYDAACTESDTAGTVLIPVVGVGCWRIIYPNPDKLDVRYFGAFPSTGAAQVDVLAELNRAAATHRPLYFPGAEETLSGFKSYHISATWSPTRGLTGLDNRDVSIEAMAASFTGDMLIDFLGVSRARQVFSGITYDSNLAAKYVWSRTDGSANGSHIFTHNRIEGGTEYQIYFPASGSAGGMQTVGSIWISNEILTRNNASALLLGTASDDITFIGTRFTSLGTPNAPYIKIHEAINVSFLNTFISWANDFRNIGNPVVFLFKNARAASIKHLFWEVRGTKTFTHLQNIIKIEGFPSIDVSHVQLFGSDDTMPDDSGFIMIGPGGSGGNVRLYDIRSILKNFKTLIMVDHASRQVLGKVQRVEFSGVDAFETLVRLNDGERTAAPNENMHLIGSHRGIIYNHGYTATTSVITLTHKQPTIVAVDLDLIAANGDVARLVCPPSGATIQRIEIVIDGALATADAVITTKIAGVTVSGGGITVTQAGSATNDIDFAVPTAANDCTAGQVITHEVFGGNTAGVSATVLVHLAPTE